MEAEEEENTDPSDESYHFCTEHCSSALQVPPHLLLQESSGAGMISPTFRAKNKGRSITEPRSKFRPEV